MRAVDDAPRLTREAIPCARDYLLEATCDACARACPEGAIALGRGGPAVDLAACSRCGACVAACPEQVFALTPPASAPKLGAPPADRHTARFAPDAAHPLAAGPPWLPPLGSLGLARLAQLWLAGVRQLRLAATPGAKAQAPASPATSPAASPAATRRALADFNALARARGLEGMRLTRASAAETRGWLAQAQARTDDAPANASRRALIRMAVTQAAADGPSETAAEALGRFQALAPSAPSAPTAFAPHIDPENCSACDDCLNICPHAALTMIKAPDGDLLYASDAAACTGCGLCVDICDEGAVSLVGMGQQGPGGAPDVALVGYVCRGCGVPSHTTRPAPPADGLCRICRQTGHYKKLFVVLD